MDQVNGKPLISEAERARRRESVNHARESARVKGFVVSPEAEALNQRYIDGKLTSEELTRAILEIHRARERR
jgi:hypothetical protein